MRTEPSPHVQDRTLERLACNELSAAEIGEVMEHLAGCESCNDVWQAVERMREAASEFDPGAISPPDIFAKKPLWRRSWVGLAAAAVLAVVVIALPRSQEPTTPPGRDAQIVRSQPQSGPRALSPTEGSQVTNPEFEWSALEGSTGYTLELLDRSGNFLWTSDLLEDCSSAWPSSVESRPGTYYWRVSAHFEDAEPPQVSPLVSFELMPE